MAAESPLAEPNLAPSADPFAPAAISVAPAAPSGTGKARSPRLTRTATGGFLTGGHDRDIPTLPVETPPPTVSHPVSQKPEVAPELIGTLLGDQPSAVFRGDRALVVVPVGGTIGRWRVTAVSHGTARVQSAAGSIQLSVGGTRGAADVHVRLSEEPVGESYAMGEMPEMAQMPQMPRMLEMAKPAPSAAPALPATAPPAAPVAPALPAQQLDRLPAVMPAAPAGTAAPEEDLAPVKTPDRK
jgi:hypothetical protein